MGRSRLGADPFFGLSTVPLSCWISRQLRSGRASRPGSMSRPVGCLRFHPLRNRGWRIDKRPVIPCPHAVGEFRGFDFIAVHQMKNGLAAADEIVGDDPPVTAPPQRFRAHDGTSSLPAQGHEHVQTAEKLRRERIIGVVVKALVIQYPLSDGGMYRALPRRPPSSTMCSYPIPKGDKLFGSASPLNCGFLRERRTVLMSTINVTSAARSRATNSGIDRVE